MSEQVVDLTFAEKKVLESYGRRVPILAIASTQEVDESWAQLVVDRYAAGDHLTARKVARNARIVESHDEVDPAVVAELPEPAATIDGPPTAVEPEPDVLEPPTVAEPPIATAPPVVELDPATYPWPETAETLRVDEILTLAFTTADLDLDVSRLYAEITKKGMELAALLRDRQQVASRIPELVAHVGSFWRAQCDRRCEEIADPDKLADRASAWARRSGKDWVGTGAAPHAVIVAYLEDLLTEVPNGR